MSKALVQILDRFKGSRAASGSMFWEFCRAALVLLAFQAGAAEVPIATLSIKIKGLKSQKGGITIAVYDDAKAYPTNASKAVATGYIKEIPPGATEVTLQFPRLKPGNYAVSAFHDEDGDRRLGTNFLGIPNEPLGASRDAKGTFGPPKFEDAVVAVSSDTQIEINMD